MLCVVKHRTTPFVSNIITLPRSSPRSSQCQGHHHDYHSAKFITMIITVLRSSPGLSQCQNHHICTYLFLISAHVIPSASNCWSVNNKKGHTLTRFNKICHPSQRPRWQVDKEAIGLSRVQQCSSTYNPPS